MRIIKNDEREAISEVIQGFFLALNPIIVWENIADNDQRKIHAVKIENVDNETESLSFVDTAGRTFQFSGPELFFFSEDHDIIFKTVLNHIEGAKLVVKSPHQVKCLEADEKLRFEDQLNSFKASLDDLNKIDTHNEADANEPSFDHSQLFDSLSEHDSDLLKSQMGHITLEEEDKAFEDVRESPRAKPEEGKMVTVQTADESKAQATYGLYDLSQGGLSFLVFSKDEYYLGEKIRLKAFDIKKFESPMLLEVKSIREADELGIQYKVGCQFVLETD
jgi:hypothetical protein